MRKERDILDEYQQNDFFGRMHLFLQYRDLRGVFQEMERKESKAPGPAVISNENPDQGELPKLFSILRPLEGTK
jgi:hypothetical protein